ncbi:hypothetical protein [Helicobacter sp. 11S03491-1]|uniref:hypothetical protein n=1 Tax=Helicobacter sp. 11S03491-1 TaxID=1476196 RepID=UPI000BA7991B|nr:hypothetical protein [Helicobacter sp. 11S03491-1]PAF43809.1 hypothetical protein BKH45_00660 [Helicobacter sp. 11S03491-1]
MYDIWFYLFFWAIGIFFALPIVMMGFAWIILQKSTTHKAVALRDIELLVDGSKKPEDFEQAISKFLKYFKSLPQGKKDLKYWLEIVEKIASSEYFDSNYANEFTEELENANEDIQKDIADKITTALKNRKKG